MPFPIISTQGLCICDWWCEQLVNRCQWHSHKSHNNITILLQRPQSRGSSITSVQFVTHRNKSFFILSSATVVDGTKKRTFGFPFFSSVETLSELRLRSFRENPDKQQSFRCWCFDTVLSTDTVAQNLVVQFTELSWNPPRHKSMMTSSPNSRSHLWSSFKIWPA